MGEPTDRDHFGSRYTVVRRLGEGGMGVVFEAIDTERRSSPHIALKTMRRMDAAALFRFKSEFRALADVAHPNLVALHELHAEGAQTFFTMELVTGVDFIQHVRFGAAAAFAVTDPVAARSSAKQPVASAVPNSPRASLLCDLERLRDGLRQLALGVAALHRAGKLHRDIKPPNVLVTREGRVVLLDFGLATDTTQDAHEQRTMDHQAAGTAEYMSPEQAASGELTEATDWYSVGVVLYESLTGRLPFMGPRLKVMMDKQHLEPAAPSALVERVPEDLNALCTELLQRNPARRPSGSDVMRRLGVENLTSAPNRLLSPGSTIPTISMPFVGRERHMTALAEAFEIARSGRAVAAFVRGSSGMGKSILVRRFLDSLGTSSDALVLTGRCYEREYVPYKAFDSLVDSLSRYLRRLPEDQAEAVLPREVLTLARIFPVLMRVPAVARAPKRAVEFPDPQELRRRAFAALRELVARLRNKRPVVLWIDDVQWGDADSAGLVAELFRAPEPPPILLIGSYRSEDAATSALLPALLDPVMRQASAAEFREIDVAELSHEEARALALSLLGGGDRETADAIAGESRGIPLFVDELVRHVQSGNDENTLPGVRLDGLLRLDRVLARRIGTLPPDAQRLLHVIAVAGRPIDRRIAAQAAELGSEGDATALALLRTGHLVRTTRTVDRHEVETFHDRVRETVVQHLGAKALKHCHAQLATALVAGGAADPEALVMHFQGAGEHERAAEQAVLAAAKAVEALAFDRGALLYRLALDLHPLSRDPARALRSKLADALVLAGRGAEGAKEFLTAAEGAHAADALELQRRAAEQFLRSGHIDEGLDAIRGVLAAVGMTLPRTARGALFSLLWRRAYLAVRGLGFRERDPSQISAEMLTKIDVCWSVTAGLGVVDMIRAFDFQTRQLVLALEAGELHRIARAVGFEQIGSAGDGIGRSARTARLTRLAYSLADKCGTPYARGAALSWHAAAAFIEGDRRQALRLMTEGEAHWKKCIAVRWELSSQVNFQLWTLWYLGELREITRRLPREIADARERGDLYLLTSLQTGLTNSGYLAADDPDRAFQEATTAMEKWSNRHVHLQHYFAALAHAHVHLYRGTCDDGVARRLLDQWPGFRSAMLFRVDNVRIEAVHLRARCVLAAASSSPDPEVHLRQAERDARALSRERAPWGKALGLLASAGVAASRGDRERAASHLARAIPALEAADMQLYVAVARRRHGELLGGDAGRALVDAGNAFMTAQDIKQPSRWAEMLAPGFSPVCRPRLLNA